MKVISITYSCEKCGLTDIPLKLDLSGIDPEGDDIDLAANIAPAMAADHRLRSPHCENGQLDAIKAPGTSKVQ